MFTTSNTSKIGTMSSSTITNDCLWKRNVVNNPLACINRTSWPADLMSRFWVHQLISISISRYCFLQSWWWPPPPKKILIQAPQIAPVSQHFTCSSLNVGFKLLQWMIGLRFVSCSSGCSWGGLFPWCVSMCCPAVGHQCHHGVPVRWSVLIYRAVSSFTHAKCQDPKIYSGVSPRGNRDDCALF